MGAEPRGFLTGDRAHDQRNVDVLLEAVREMYAVEDLGERLARAVDHAIVVSGAERGVLLLVGPDGVPAVRVARDRHGREVADAIPFSRTAVREVWRTGHTIHAADDNGRRVDEFAVSVPGLRSVLAVRFPSEGRPIGVLYLDSRFAVKQFSPGDLAVVVALGNLVAAAIAHAKEAEERRRLRHEVEVAGEIQRRLLPVAPRAPVGYDLASASRPARETSGDYYDVVPLSDGRLALVVADVAGKGLPAALIMAATRAVVRGLLRSRDDLASVLRDSNLALAADIPPDRFVTMFVGVLDPAAATLQWANAGHEPPVLRRADGTLVSLGATGPALGPDPLADYDEGAPVRLGRGDAFVLFTDGILDALSGDDERFGEERLRTAILSHGSNAGSAAGLLGGLFTEVARFSRGTTPFDDLTCVVLRREA